MLARLRDIAGPRGVMSFRDFTKTALYEPHIGYYTQTRVPRTGRNPQSDFYTASNLSSDIFGRLVRSAAIALLAPDEPSVHSLVEIGAEPDGGIFSGIATPFIGIETRHLGDSLAPPSRSVIFANELLDAQPFHRFVRRANGWIELGVRVNGPSLEEIELPEVSVEARSFIKTLPSDVAEGYLIDYSLDAENLLRSIASGTWRGLLILADYGHDWATLIHDRPAGTARAYHRHTISSDLFANPGAQDLTCHVCWDRLEAVLRDCGFHAIRVETQEAFFVRHAERVLSDITMQNPAAFSTARQTIMELLHPSHLGLKFQFLSARR